MGKTSKSLAQQRGNLNTFVPKHVSSQRTGYLYIRGSRFYRYKVQALTLVAQPEALLGTLLPPDPTRGSELSLVPRDIYNRAKDFVNRIRRAGGWIVLRVCSRKGDGSWWIHLHFVVSFLAAAQIERFAHRSNLLLNYLEPVRHAEKVKNYMFKTEQVKLHDRVEGRAYLTAAPKRPKEAEAL